MFLPESLSNLPTGLSMTPESFTTHNVVMNSSLWLWVFLLYGLHAAPTDPKLAEQHIAMMFQMCTEFCDSMLFHCILRVHCPKTFPLPIPEECMDQLNDCMDECDNLFQPADVP